MAPFDHVEPRIFRRVCGGAISVALHVALLIAILSGGRHDGLNAGDSPTLKVVLFEAPDADKREGTALPPVEPADPAPPVEEQLLAAITGLIAEALDEIRDEPAEPAMAVEPPSEDAPPIAIEALEIPATFAMSEVESAAIAQRLERLAEESVGAAHTEVAWEQDGRKYSAVLIRERANDGTALERVVAQVSASDRGRRLTTQINLNRLAFSQFTQMVDRWDPMVQLHDDEIVGRFHSNSRFNLMYDSRTAPKFFGKVTTAARSFNTESRGRRRDSDIFRAGVQTRAGLIELPSMLQPFEWAPREPDARVHEIASDTRIRFFADGSYSWRSRGAAESNYLNDPSDHPVYFIAAEGTSVFVQGVVAGKVLVYSPYRIVIEGNLVYANDPREKPESRDYLGLVSDRYVEVAPPGTTGPGDLEIDAAIFAGRKFLVRDIDHMRAATLRIFGSLTAGTLSATEPRYATKIDYDPRFERQRPPGFPSTNRYQVAEWNGQWTEVPERTADESF